MVVSATNQFTNQYFSEILMSCHPTDYSLCHSQGWKQALCPGDKVRIERFLFVAKGENDKPVKAVVVSSGWRKIITKWHAMRSPDVRSERPKSAAQGASKSIWHSRKHTIVRYSHVRSRMQCKGAAGNSRVYAKQYHWIRSYEIVQKITTTLCRRESHFENTCTEMTRL